MALPWELYAGAAAEALPPLAALRYGRSLPTARRWIALWGLLLLATDAIMLALALQRRNNHWVPWVSNPLEVAALLSALSCWHRDGVLRQGLRLTIPAFAVVWVLLIVFVEGTSTFSLVAGPLKALLFLAVSATTLLVRIRREEGNLAANDWFWVCLGLCLRYGSAAGLHPIARILLPLHSELVSSAYQIQSLVDVVSFVLIAGGMLCPIPPPPSGGRSSPGSWPSPSSSPPSAQRW